MTQFELLQETEAWIVLRQERKCPICHEKEWMNPGEQSCWRCERIAQGYPVAKPNGMEGYFWWNYQQHTWVPLAGGCMPEGPEWGKRP